MSKIESKIMSSIPKWDGKVATCAMYLAQVNTLAEYYNFGDALDEVEMRVCPTKAEYSVIDQDTVLADVDSER